MEQYSSSVRWQIDTTIRVLTLAGTRVEDKYIYTLIHLISACPDQHAYAVHSTFLALRENLKQEGLVVFAMWMMGEFGQYLLQPYTDATLTAQPVTGTEILRSIEDILQNPKTSTKVRDYALTGLIKLAVKLPSENFAQVNTLVMSQMNWPVSEVQQRSMEYLALMDARFQEKRREFVKAVPLSRRAETLMKSRSATGEEEPVSSGPVGNGEKLVDMGGKEETKKSDIKKEFEDLLFDIPQGQQLPEQKAVPESTINILEEVFKGIGTAPAAQPAIPASSTGGANLLDFGPAPAAPPMMTSATANAPPAADLLNLFPTSSAPQASFAPTMTAAEPKKALEGVKIEGFSDSNIRIEFEMDHKDTSKSGERHIVASFIPLTANDITALNMQVALQKHVKMVKLNPATESTVYGNKSNSVKQEMRVVNTLDGTKPIAMKIKLTYTCQGAAASEMKLVTFPLNA